MSYTGFIFTADNHIQSHVWSTHRTLTGDTEHGFKCAVEAAITKQVPLVIGGDLFNSVRPNSHEVATVQAELRKLTEAGLPCYWIDGNHDKSAPSWSQVLGVTSLDRQTVQIGNANVYGLNYRPRMELQAELAKIPESTDILVVHQLLELGMGFVGAWNLSSDWVPEYVPTVLIGDLHKRKTFTCPSTQVEFWYPGSTAMMSIDEQPDKYVLYVDTSGDTPDVHQAKLPTRAYAEITIRTDEKNELDVQLSSLLAKLDRIDSNWGSGPSELRKPLVRVILYQDTGNALQAIRGTIGDRCHLFVKQVAVTTTEDEDKSAVDSSVSIDTILQEFIDAEVDPDIYSMVKSLVTTDDVADVINAARTELGGLVENAVN